MENRLKDVKLLELNETYYRIMYYFFSFPDIAIGLNELAKNIKKSKTATKQGIIKLIKEGFLKKEEIGNAWRISADIKSPYMIMRKIPYNLQLIYESGIIAAVYNKVPGAKAVILFGSYRYGTDNEKSDIDIAAEVLENKPLKIETLGVIEKLGCRKNVKVNLHVFSKKKIDLNLFTNIANGIILDGVLEVKP